MATRYFMATMSDGQVVARSSVRSYVCCDSRGSWSTKPKRGAYPAIETDARTYRAILAGRYQPSPEAMGLTPQECADFRATERPLTLRQHIQAALASDEHVDLIDEDPVEKPFYVIAHRGAGSIFGAATAPVKKDGTILRFATREAALEYAKELNDRIVSANVYYSVGGGA
jgi:hypothetical protein